MDFKKTAEDGSILTWWDVTPTGDHGADCKTGNEYAEQFIDALQSGQALTAFTHIVNGFPKPLTGIEIGFLHTISEFIAGEGAWMPKPAVGRKEKMSLHELGAKLAGRES